MACYYPSAPHHGPDGRLFSTSRPWPCGQCIGCRIERSRQWATRCIHEAQMNARNVFVTLTYDELHLPENSTLEYRDFKLFLKRLRRRMGQKIRFYMAGEYGDKGRPHYHACLFGVDFDDKIYLRTTDAGAKLYTSETLQKIWQKGFTSCGTVTFESAAYVARYIMKKRTGQQAEQHYERTNPDSGEIYNLKPEFNQMSRMPGIGAAWLNKFQKDVYPKGTVVVGTKEQPAPRYYDRKYKKTNESAYKSLKRTRQQMGDKTAHDKTPRRLATREIVKQAQIQTLKRTLQ